MSDRDAALAAFLATTTAAHWRRDPLDGDASARRFIRMVAPEGHSLMLMDADPARGEALGPFLAIAAHLSGLGLCAPRIEAADAAAGFALVEDLGHLHVAGWLVHSPDQAETLYSAAVDVLIRLQGAPLPAGLVALHPGRAAAMIDPLFDWYLPEPDARWRAHVIGLLQAALAAHAPEARTLALRDFHAENLIWRPHLAGTDRIGLIDFQDAVAAPAEYDLISLLRDARRDVDPGLAAAMTARFAAETGRDPAAVAAACAVLGAQRNLRILGIFARLARRDGKRRYLDFMPRVHGQILADLRHPGLAELAAELIPGLPAPKATA